MSSHTLGWISLFVGGWAVVSGILHDIAVIKDHFKEYDRQFLYYLLNGHILVFSGVFQMISFAGISNDQLWGSVVSGAAAVGMIIYCAMIWKFLPSFVTMFMQSGMLIVLLLHSLHIF